MDELNVAVDALFAEDPDRDYLLISAPITRALHGNLTELLRHRELKPAATVFLTTYGGDPDGGYRIARCLRHHYKDRLRVAVPSWCKSAGTLIAIAASELAIGDRGELGPLDVQVFKGSELQERSSGLDLTEALGFVGHHVRWAYHSMLSEARRLGLSTKLAADMAAHISAAVAAPLLTQVDPLRLGELQRATRIASDYGERLDKYSSNLKEDALQTLIHGYPSHSFVIDRKEASSLFQRVYPFTDAEQTFVDAVWPIVQDQAPSAVHFIDPIQTSPTTPGVEDENLEANDDQQPREVSEGGGPGHSDSSGEGLQLCASVVRAAQHRKGRDRKNGGKGQTLQDLVNGAERKE